MGSVARTVRGRGHRRCDENMYQVGAVTKEPGAATAKYEMRKDEGSPEEVLREQSNPRAASKIEEEREGILGVNNGDHLVHLVHFELSVSILEARQPLLVHMSVRGHPSPLFAPLLTHNKWYLIGQFELDELGRSTPQPRILRDPHLGHLKRRHAVRAYQIPSSSIAGAPPC